MLIRHFLIFNTVIWSYLFFRCCLLLSFLIRHFFVLDYVIWSYFFDLIFWHLLLLDYVFLCLFNRCSLVLLEQRIDMSHVHCANGLMLHL